MHGLEVSTSRRSSPQNDIVVRSWKHYYTECSYLMKLNKVSKPCGPTVSTSKFNFPQKNHEVSSYKPFPSLPQHVIKKSEVCSKIS